MQIETERRFYRLIGKQVRTRRGGRFTQQKLAELVGVSRTSITNLERGDQNVPVHILLRIADHLHCEIGDLLPRWKDLRPDEHIDVDVIRPPFEKITARTEEVIRKYTTRGGDGS